MDPNQFYQQIVEHINQKRYPVAKEMLSQLVSQIPKEPNIWNTYGCVECHLENWTAAMHCFYQGLTFSPKVQKMVLE